MMLSAAILSLALGFSNCSNSQNKQTSDTEVHNHDGHDHEGHDHGDVDHSSYDHARQSEKANEAMPDSNTVKESAQKAPATNIPAFTFYKVKSGISFTNADIPKGKNTAFILFDPSCGHCQKEASELGKNYNKVKNVNIYFVSMNDPALMANFLETFAKELVGKPNVEVLYDRNQDFIQKFHIPKQFPANYVYDANHKLTTHWDGERKIDNVIAAYTK